MTSAISLRRFLFAEIKQNAWLPALVSVVALFIYPLRFLMELQSITRYMAYTRTGSEILFEEAAVSIFGIGDPLTLTALLVAAVLCAAASYAYLDSRDKVDFYHSLALRRGKLYGVAFARGWLSAAVPYAVFVLIAYFIVGAMYGTVNQKTAGVLFPGMAVHLIAFTSVFAVCVLAMVVTGRLLTGLLMSAFLLAYGPVCYFLLRALVSSSLITYWGSGSEYTEPVRLLSPAMSILGLNRFTEGLAYGQAGSFPAVETVILAVWAAVSVFLGIFIYRRRASEAAENAMISPVLETVIKVAVIIPGALLCGIVLSDIADGGYGWAFTGTILGAVVIHGVMEFIYQPDIKNVGRRWRSGLAGLAAAAAVMIFMMTDPLGYDRWLPEESEVEAMACYDLALPYRFGSVSVDNTEMLKDVLRNIATEDPGAIYSVAEEGVANAMRQKNGTWEDPGVYYVGENDENGVTEPESYYTVVVYFRLRDGKEKFRTYTVSEKTSMQAQRVLLSDPERAEAIYPAYHIDADDISGFVVETWNSAAADGEPEYTSKELDLTREEIRELIELLRRDTGKRGVDALSEEAVMEIIPMWNTGGMAAVDGLYDVYSLEVYPGYEETLSFIEHAKVKEEVPENMVKA